MEEQFKEIRERFEQHAGSDYAASRGENLNGIVLAAYLEYDFIDAAEVICFDEDGVFDAEKTDEKMRARLGETERAVIPGLLRRDAGWQHQDLFQRRAPTSPDRSWRVPCMQICMRTGPMSPVSW